MTDAFCSFIRKFHFLSLASFCKSRAELSRSKMSYILPMCTYCTFKGSILFLRVQDCKYLYKGAELHLLSLWVHVCASVGPLAVTKGFPYGGTSHVSPFRGTNDVICPRDQNIHSANTGGPALRASRKVWSKMPRICAMSKVQRTQVAQNSYLGNLKN